MRIFQKKLNSEIKNKVYILLTLIYKNIYSIKKIFFQNINDFEKYTPLLFSLNTNNYDFIIVNY